MLNRDENGLKTSGCGCGGNKTVDIQGIKIGGCCGGSNHEKSGDNAQSSGGCCGGNNNESSDDAGKCC